MYTTQQYAEGLVSALGEAAPKDHDRIIENFIGILTTNNDLEKYADIIAQVETMLRNQTPNAEITVARDVEINNELMETLNAIAAQDVVVKTQVNEEILGGVIIKVDDTLIDASLKTQLNKLRNKLSN